ncbi:type IV pilin protein [Thiobacter aerophilum]
MIVVTIIGILAAIAYPSYVEYVQRSRRAEARAALLGAVQALERYYTERNTYSGATLGVGGIYPSASEHGFYTLALNTPSATSYTLTATPQGSQAGDQCGSFSINEQGVKSVSGGSLPVDVCW